MQIIVKTDRCDRTDKILNDLIFNLKSNPLIEEMEKDFEMFRELKEMAEYCKTANIWPFNIKTTRSLIAVYGIQLVALIFNL